jgi:hypothetical protein
MEKQKEDKKTGVAVVAEASSSSSGMPGSSSTRSAKTHIYFFEDDDQALPMWKVEPQTPKPQLYANPWSMDRKDLSDQIRSSWIGMKSDGPGSSNQKPSSPKHARENEEASQTAGECQPVYHTVTPPPKYVVTPGPKKQFVCQLCGRRYRKAESLPNHKCQPRRKCPY